MKETIKIGGQTYDHGDLIRDRFGISEMTIYRWTKRGLLPPPIRLGRSNYYRRMEVEARLAEGE